jgi:hypothetical protein
MKKLKIGDLVKVFTLCGLKTRREYTIIAVYSNFAVGENNGRHIAYHLNYTNDEAMILCGNDGNRHVVNPC